MPATHTPLPSGPSSLPPLPSRPLPSSTCCPPPCPLHLYWMHAYGHLLPLLLTPASRQPCCGGAAGAHAVSEPVHASAANHRMPSHAVAHQASGRSRRWWRQRMRTVAAGVDVVVLADAREDAAAVVGRRRHATHRRGGDGALLGRHAPQQRLQHVVAKRVLHKLLQRAAALEGGAKDLLAHLHELRLLREHQQRLGHVRAVLAR
mmetsp:Transcript_72903/g.200086  ORF Transcript_72903/g.200086 Transcript_72903/m.200086 type:complete len:205 (-) Transcript_72903:1712-2326(-)